jgi:hypothetical protein
MSILARNTECNDDVDECLTAYPVTKKYVWRRFAFEYTPSDIYLRAVCFSLADHANDNGEAWPALKLIQYEIGATENTVMDRIKQLASAGFLVCSKRRYNGAKWRHNHYQLAVPEYLLSTYVFHMGASA